MAELRICKKCNREKLISDFVFEKRSGNYLNYCVERHKQYHKEYYERRKAQNANKVVKIDPNATKRCIKCKVEKPLTEFSIDKANGKLVNTCKTCKALTTKQNYLKNRDKRLAYTQEYREANREPTVQKTQNNAEYSKRYRVENAEEISQNVGLRP